MSYANYSPKEVETLGEDIYARTIRDSVEPAENGKFVVIDVVTGEYELADTDLQATQQMLARRPDAVLYGIRIGHRVAYTLGVHAALS